MTSRGRKALSVTCGDSSPKGEPRHRILAQEMERICIDTLHSLFYGYPSMRVPPESRMVVKRFPSRHPASPCGRGGQRSEDGEGQITATSIGKCWHLRRQMTSRGRKALSVTCGDSSPKGRAKASYIGTRNGAYLYRYAPFTVLRLPLNARAARKSDGRKTVSVPAPLASPCGRGGQRSEDGEGQITATSIGKCWHLRRQMTSRGRKALSVTCGDSSPKGRAKASYIGTRNGAYLYRYAPFTVLRLPLNARAARKSDGRKTVSVPALPVGEVALQRGRRRANNGNPRKMLAPSQADDVPGRKALSVTCGELSQKESQGIVYWHKKWISVSIRSIQRYPSMPENAGTFANRQMKTSRR